MHPLPPPRPVDRSREQQLHEQQLGEQQLSESRPTASTIQGVSAPQNQTQSATSVPQASADDRKKRKHRGGKKKRNRRQSFAAPLEDSPLPTLEERPPLLEV